MPVLQQPRLKFRELDIKRINTKILPNKGAYIFLQQGQEMRDILNQTANFRHQHRQQDQQRDTAGQHKQQEHHKHCRRSAEPVTLQAIHQRAVNAEEVEKRLDAEQQQVKNDLALMPYNIRAMQQKQKENAHLGLGDAPGSDIDVTDDSVSDLPAPHWTCKPPLKQPYVQRLARMWMGFARQNLRLKSLVSDIVASQLRAHCTRCRSVYRL